MLQSWRRQMTSEDDRSGLRSLLFVICGARGFTMPKAQLYCPLGSGDARYDARPRLTGAQWQLGLSSAATIERTGAWIWSATERRTSKIRVSKLCQIAGQDVRSR